MNTTNSLSYSEGTPYFTDHNFHKTATTTTNNSNTTNTNEMVSLWCCFPAAARVSLENWELIKMSELEIGDRVLTRGHTGNTLEQVVK